jgi:uncharacterized protein involved in exopolysaccharide biosynthesis
MHVLAAWSCRDSTHCPASILQQRQSMLRCCRCREQGALEQAAVSAQRQADDLRSRLAEAHSNWQLAQAAAAAAEQERAELLQQASQQLNRASLVEQVCACSWFVGGATSCTCVAALILLAAAAVEQRTFARQQDKSFSSCI